MNADAAHGAQAPHDGEELTCQELVELVTAYREGSLPPSDNARFEAHLAVCPPCVNYVEQIDTTVRALGSLDEHITEIEQDPATLELLKTFRSWKSAQQG